MGARAVGRAGWLFLAVVLGGCGGDGAVTSSLRQVASGFVPASLGAPSQRAGDPCAAIAGSGIEQFLGCQAILLRSYLATSKRFFDATLTLVEEVEGKVEEGSGTADLGEGEMLSWSKTGETNQRFLMKNNGESRLYVAVSGTTYTLQLDGDELGTRADPGHFESVIEYRSATSWTQTLRLTSVGCDSTALNNPEKMRIVMTREGDLWVGKAMTYHPFSEGCAVAASDAKSMVVYTDFVADSSAAKANVFFLSRAVADLSTLSNFALGRVCQNYASYCGGSSTSYEASFPNPFCNPTSTLTAVWGNTCSVQSPTVSSTDFGNASLWVVPSTFHVSEAVALPTAL